MKWLVWLLPTTSPRDDDVSVWSVPRRDRRAFFQIVFCLWLAAIGVLVYKERKNWPGWRDTVDLAIEVLTDFGALVLALVAVAMLLARAGTTTGDMLMSLNDWIKSRYVTPVIEAAEARGLAQGIAQGVAQGVAKGSAAERAEWRAWNDRRLAAEQVGRKFDEPPPGG